MSIYNLYLQLIKPFWAPPSWVFGPVWTVLYIFIAVSFGAVFRRVLQRQLPMAVALPFALNLLFNFLFTPIQFGLRNNMLAAIDVFLVLVTLAWAVVVIWPRMRWVAYVNIPYLFWVVFATFLQFTITYLNF